MKQVSLLYDLTATQPMSGSTRHGGGKYGEIVLKRMIAREFPLVCFYDGEKWLNPDIKNMLYENNVKLYDINKQGLKEIIKSSKTNVLYSALPSKKLIEQTDIKVIGTIHGLRRLETPPDSYLFKYRNLNWKDWFFYFFKKFASGLLRKRLCSYYIQAWKNPDFQMVTVSHHTSNAIKVFLPELKYKDIPVFYSPSTTEYEITEKRYCDKYFMMISGNRLEKNNLRAIIALDRLFTNGFLDGFNVRVTGTKKASDFRYKIQNPKRFQFMGYVNDKELEQLYHDAYCLIYPSVNEGFGYPPLEAMHYGTPVISSSFCSIPEVCGKASLYFNPFAIEEIANRVLQIADLETRIHYSHLASKQYRTITERQKRDLDGLIDYIYKC